MFRRFRFDLIINKARGVRNHRSPLIVQVAKYIQQQLSLVLRNTTLSFALFFLSNAVRLFQFLRHRRL